MRVLPVRVRPVRPQDASEWFRMRDALWPGTPDDHRGEIERFLRRPSPGEACLVAEDADGRLHGFAELRLRDVAEGCTTAPVGYLEGIYVEPEARRRGVARALVTAAEGWARAAGCGEMASDRDLDNEASGRFHEASGFDEVVRAVHYRKAL
ncbi:MAG: GNAT family N-acetyltransferase [Gemmatimonadetes bacterium]|nr:GNAT family N-acetyltransferase [Gemmatimonadota bacterium]NNK61617.1 GNAT family N-acetyltransferase [Gemmatimonadota bacterium]